MMFPSQEHYTLLRRGQQALNDAIPILDMAEECGVDCSDYRNGHAELSGRIDKYLRNFFPNQVIPSSPAGVNVYNG